MEDLGVLDVDTSGELRDGVTLGLVAVLVGQEGQVGDGAVRMGELEAARLGVAASIGIRARV